MALGDNVMAKEEMVNGSLAQATITIGENRYNLLNLINFESTVKPIMRTRGVLGRAGKVHYPTGWEGTWKGKLSYNAPIFRDLLVEFKNTGKLPSFDITVYNENKGGTIGGQNVIHTGCVIDSAILSKIDIETEDELTEDISGTFDGFDILQSFGDGAIEEL